MKINKTDYARLEVLITDAIGRNNIGPRSDYDISETRYNWDIYHITCDWSRNNNKEDYSFITGLYDYLNDSHMNTALRHIIQ